MQTNHNQATKYSQETEHSQETEAERRDAWVLRAGAELWKAVMLEAEHPAEDTQKALTAVRRALNCARRLRHAAALAEAERHSLETECGQAAEAQVAALRQWGRGRGLRWDDDFGICWGQALSSFGEAPDPLSTQEAAE